MSIIDRAIEFAAGAHRSQNRKGTDIPYISHPFAVGLILQKAGCSDEVIAAGILHDTLEDTETMPEMLESAFGTKVLRIVEGCSEPDKGASWEERKQHTLDDLKYASLSIRQVACADKLHNIRSVKRDLAQHGEEAWTRFKRGREAQEWYYKGLVESLGYASRFPLLEDLQNEVEDVFGPHLEVPEWRALRRDKKFMDLAFETAYGNREDIEERKSRFEKFGAWGFIRRIHENAYPIHPSYQEEFHKVAEYLHMRGIEFQSNSDGPIMQIGFCAVLMRLLNLQLHEVYHHFKRNLERGYL